MSLLVFYHNYGDVGPVEDRKFQLVKGEGTMHSYSRGLVISLCLNGETHHRQIYTPFVVLDDSSTPPRVIHCDDNGAGKWWTKCRPGDVPPFFIDLNGTIRRRDGACVMEIAP